MYFKNLLLKTEFRFRFSEIKPIPLNAFSYFLKYIFVTGWHFIAETLLGSSHSQSQGNNIYNLKFILMGSNRSRPYDLKVSNFLFSKNKWAIQRGQLLVSWPISAVYVIASYEKHILNKTRPKYHT